MKAVLDTNVWLDWLVFADPSARTLETTWTCGSLELLACHATRAEWQDVLSRPALAIAPSVRRAAADAFDQRVRILAQETIPLVRHPSLLCRDPDDQKFIDLALISRTDFLVTRDKALLSLARAARTRHGLEIVSPVNRIWRDSLQRCLSAFAAPAQTL
jgi:putative PIN family toxin of toxin-antitoxin system